jgi:hypothetical protein
MLSCPTFGITSVPLVPNVWSMVPLALNRATAQSVEPLNVASPATRILPSAWRAMA